jgi:hypothetical protein
MFEDSNDLMFDDPTDAVFEENDNFQTECHMLIDWLIDRPYYQFTDVDVTSKPQCLISTPDCPITLWGHMGTVDPEAHCTVDMRVIEATGALRWLARSGVGYAGPCSGISVIFKEKTDEQKAADESERRKRAELLRQEEAAFEHEHAFMEDDEDTYSFDEEEEHAKNLQYFRL